MSDQARIGAHLDAVLANSNLSLQRRAEVADELRGHLEQCVADKHAAGLSETLAIDAAIADFGDPAVVRADLEAHQRRLDHRHAWVRLRGGAWYLLPLCAVLSAAVATLSPAPPSSVARVVGGALLFACFAGGFAAFIYFSQVWGARLECSRPRREFNLRASTQRNLGWVAAGLVFLLAWIMLTLLAVGPFLCPLPGSDGLGLALPLHWARALLEPMVGDYGAPAALAGFALRLALSGVLLFGSALVSALYERSHCVDEAPAY